jgi:hypothetical protein
MTTNRKWWAVGVIGLLVYAGIPVVGLLRDGPPVPTSGPLQSANGSFVAVPAAVGEPVDFAFLTLENPTSAPMRLESFAFTTLPKAVHVVDVLVETAREGRVGGAFYGPRPPARVGGVWKPFDGGTVPAHSSAPVSELGELAVALEGSTPGRWRAAGLRIAYEWQGAQYVATFADAMVLCVGDTGGCS